MKKIYTLITALVVLYATTNAQTKIDSASNNGTDHLVLATLWFQKSAEMRASYYQGFNLATMILDQQKKVKTKKKKAVVLDIDETVLDNSPFQGRAITIDTPYTFQYWKEWTDAELAEALPGASDFLHYAAKNGYEIFYVSNRKVSELYSTLNNLKKVGFPFADTTHIILRNETPSKESRREKIREKYEIVLLIGDNLADLHVMFEDRSQNYGFDAVDKVRADFGTKYVILPNPMYGDWENDYYKGLDNTDYKGRTNRRIHELKVFTPNK